MARIRPGKVIFSAVLLSIMLITGLMRYFFRNTPPPSFADFYLAAILVLAYWTGWKLAAALAGASLLLSVYLLVPIDRTDIFTLVSYSVCAAVVICVMAALRRRTART